MLMVGAEAASEPPPWLDYISAFSGVLGALFAAGAILYASRQTQSARRDLAHERRMDFELGVLAELSEQFATTGTDHLRGHLLSLIREEHDETDLPTLRALLGVRAGEVGKLQLAALKRLAAAEDPQQYSAFPRSQLVKSMIAREIDDAIVRRLRPEASQTAERFGPVCPHCAKRVLTGRLPEHMQVAHGPA
jgi:hypothetical protein